jgi:DNA-binding NarL/FixJ family response regulator/class 3 adenylate cyclase
MGDDAAAAVKTFLIADIRGFTRFTSDLGDEEAGRLATRFAATTRDVVERRDGTLLELRGDEALAIFNSVRAAVRAAIELQFAYVTPEGEKNDPLPVGIGIDAGEAVRVDEGFRGGALNLAARLCGFARAGEVLVSQEAAHLAGTIEGVVFEDRGSVRLKNLPEPVRVLRAAPLTDDPAERFASRGLGEPSISVVVADDSVLFREGVVRVLSEAGFEIAGTAGDADELIDLVRADPPDVAIVDIRMPPTNSDEGLVAAARIRQETPSVGVLVLSQYVETHHALTLLEDGPDKVGYLLKDRVADVGELADAVRRIAAGGSVIDPQVVAQLLRRRRERDPLEALTDRERQILALMAEGRSNQAICEQLFLSPKTVETHVGHIFDKLGLLKASELHRRVLAVVAFLRSN